MLPGCFWCGWLSGSGWFSWPWFPCEVKGAQGACRNNSNSFLCNMCLCNTWPVSSALFRKVHSKYYFPCFFSLSFSFPFYTPYLVFSLILLTSSFHHFPILLPRIIFFCTIMILNMTLLYAICFPLVSVGLSYIWGRWRTRKRQRWRWAGGQPFQAISCGEWLWPRGERHQWNR